MDGSLIIIIIIIIIIQCLYRVTTYHTGITVGPVVSNIPTYLHLLLKIYLIYQINKLL